MTADQIDRVLADFQQWLRQESEPMEDSPCETIAASIDLATLLGLFTALRQEVNLQTRSVRAQQEQNSELLAKLGQAVDVLARTASKPASAEGSPAHARSRELITALIETYDALDMAQREICRSQETWLATLASLEAQLQPMTEPATDAPPRGFWAKIFGKSPSSGGSSPASRIDPSRIHLAMQAARTTMTSVLTGYRMSLERIDRAISKHGLRSIPTLGERFDPEQMEVLEAVSQSGRPSGEVIEEIRRGYVWNGSVFRYALVRVARD